MLSARDLHDAAGKRAQGTNERPQRDSPQADVGRSLGEVFERVKTCSWISWCAFVDWVDETDS